MNAANRTSPPAIAINSLQLSHSYIANGDGRSTGYLHRLSVQTILGPFSINHDGASPGHGYSFRAWSGDTNERCQPDDAHDDRQSQHHRPTTAINSYSLAITSANGTVAKTPSQASYNYGTSVTLTATPGTGYSFTSWSGDTTSAANPMNAHDDRQSQHHRQLCHQQLQA